MGLAYEMAACSFNKTSVGDYVRHGGTARLVLLLILLLLMVSLAYIIHYTMRIACGMTVPEKLVIREESSLCTHFLGLDLGVRLRYVTLSRLG